MITNEAPCEQNQFAALNLLRERVMAKKAPKKIHAVRAHLRVPELTIAGSSLTLELFAEKHKIGEPLIGQGSLFWYGRNRQKRKRIRWLRFAEMMDELAYGK